MTLFTIAVHISSVVLGLITAIHNLSCINCGNMLLKMGLLESERVLRTVVLLPSRNWWRNPAV